MQQKRYPIIKAIRMTADQWRKLKTLGGPAWIRAMLDGVSPPEPRAVAEVKAERRPTIDAKFVRDNGCWW